jgi:hypothetical protein
MFARSWNSAYRSIGAISERDSSGAPKARTKRAARRYERSEPRIARREPQKKPPNRTEGAAGAFFVREAARPKEFCFAKFN